MCRAIVYIVHEYVFCASVKAVPETEARESWCWPPPGGEGATQQEDRAASFVSVLRLTTVVEERITELLTSARCAPRFLRVLGISHLIHM